MSHFSNVPILSVAVVVVSCGCTHTQLRRNTVNQMATVHELQQQQVLDNLAMFVQNRFAYPYYSVVSQGTSQLSDSGTLAITNGFGRPAAFLFNSLGINPTAQRQATESWIINPVNDSVKLTLMRCTYQRAIEGCFGITVSACPNCEKLFEYFYKRPANSGQNGGHGQPESIWRPKSETAETQQPSPTNDVGNHLTHEDGQQRRETAADPDEAPAGSGNATTGSGQSPHVNGLVTPWCLSFQSCWFCAGPKVPSHLERCTPIGHYCGMFVWVPAEGRDELTKLTLLIQDIAYYDYTPGHGAGAPGGTGGYIARTPSQYPYTVLGTLQLYRAATAPSRPVP